MSTVTNILFVPNDRTMMDEGVCGTTPPTAVRSGNPVRPRWIAGTRETRYPDALVLMWQGNCVPEGCILAHTGTDLDATEDGLLRLVEGQSPASVFPNAEGVFVRTGADGLEVR